MPYGAICILRSPLSLIKLLLHPDRHLSIRGLQTDSRLQERQEKTNPFYQA
jgi:hypothetical protein